MDEFMKSLACAGTECFCWILVLLNIFAVFYLVFCSFWKVSRLVKLSGWVYSGVLIGATILILFFHTCIYTLLATVFTGMMLMAILSIILPQQGEVREKAEKEKAPAPQGAYVISETFDGWFVFGLYDSKRKRLIKSTYAYESIECAKAEIASCRENGMIAETEDRSGNWIEEKFIPKFEICKYGDKYGYSLIDLENKPILCSDKFAKLGACLSNLDKVKENIDTTLLYMSMDKVSDKGYEKLNAPCEEEPIVEEEPVVEQAPARPKKCIVGVVWPENSDPEKVYRYHVQDQVVQVGDVVTAPTFDSFNKKEVVRKARVVTVEYYDEGENIILPAKTIISVEKE